MNLSMFVMLQIIGVMSAWADKALKDGKITIIEALELIVAIARLLGVPVDDDITTLITGKDKQAASGEGIEEAKKITVAVASAKPTED